MKGVFQPSRFTINSSFWISTKIEHPRQKPGTKLKQIQESLTCYGSDKTTHHDYQFPYSVLFDCMVPGSLIEIGIGTKNTKMNSNMHWYKNAKPGGSLRAWSSLGIFEKIIGGDLDEEILFNEGNISTFKVDQTKIESFYEFKKNCLNTAKVISFIIDDGLHQAKANLNTFEALFPILAEGGIYAIEDVNSKDLHQIMKSILIDFKIKDWALWGNSLRSPNNGLFVIFK